MFEVVVVVLFLLLLSFFNVFPHKCTSLISFGPSLFVKIYLITVVQSPCIRFVHLVVISSGST